MTIIPSWLDLKQYPWEPRDFTVPAGRIHYIDEGSGPPVVFVHGNPSWSFEYRAVIKRLISSRRCVALDHLGFGLSEKPSDFSYLPEDHARHFDAFMAGLDLRDVTLVVGDWGGPIGLSWALDHPERVSALVVTNTWLWPVRSDWHYRAFSGFMGGPLGRWLIRRHNFFAGRMLYSCFYDRTLLTPELHRHYLMPLARPEERKGNWTLPKQIIEASPWLEACWLRRHRLSGKKMLLAWGMADIAFREKDLNRWVGEFPGARVVKYQDCGHFVAEERGSELAEEILRL